MKVKRWGKTNWAITDFADEYESNAARELLWGFPFNMTFKPRGGHWESNAGERSFREGGLRIWGQLEGKTFTMSGRERAIKRVTDQICNRAYLARSAHKARENASVEEVKC